MLAKDNLAKRNLRGSKKCVFFVIMMKQLSTCFFSVNLLGHSLVLYLGCVSLVPVYVELFISIFIILRPNMTILVVSASYELLSY
jgi:hypothetical protein